MNLNNCHNRVIRRAQSVSFFLTALLLSGFLWLTVGCASLAPELPQNTSEPLLTAPSTPRAEEAALRLPKDRPLSDDEAKVLSQKLDTALESYDLLRPGGAVDLETLKPSVILRVVDGDTMMIEWEDQPTRLRLIGLDAPESYSHHDEALRTHEGESVSRIVTHWLDDRTIYLQFDADPYDPFERLLAYVWLDAHTMVNEVLVREGLAFRHRYPPNTHFDDYFKALQNKAKAESRGIWSIVP